MIKRYPFLPKSWIRLSLAAAFTISFSSDLTAQTAPAKQWDKTFGGNSEDVLTSLKQTADGGYILGGISQSGISGDKTTLNKGGADFWVIKLDASGTKLWDKTFGGSNDDYLNAMQQTADGGYILGGESLSEISGDKTEASRGNVDYWVIKLDASGNKVWDKSFGGVQGESLTSMQQTADGGYMLGGFSNSGISGDKTDAGKGDSDFWLVKIDANGTKVWDKAFGGSGADYLFSLQQTADGGYVAGGHSGSSISGDKSEANYGAGDYWVIRLDNNGNKIWDKTLGGSASDQLYSLRQTSDGGYIIGGYSRSGISGNKTEGNKGATDYWVVKLDATGNKLWDKTIGGSSDDALYNLAQTADGGYILGGASNSPQSADKSETNVGGFDFWVVKLNSQGNKLWDKTIGGTNNDGIFSITQTADGGFIFGGDSYSGLSGDKSQASQGDADYWIVKLAPDVLGINKSESDLSLSVFPNPNQGKFNLQLNNITVPTAEVTVTDLLGRVVLQQSVAARSQGLQELEIPAVKGMYLLQVKAGNQTSTRKIVVE